MVRNLESTTDTPEQVQAALASPPSETEKSISAEPGSKETTSAATKESPEVSTVAESSGASEEPTTVEEQEQEVEAKAKTEAVQSSTKEVTEAEPVKETSRDKRINQLTRKFRDTERENQQLKDENQRLSAQRREASPEPKPIPKTNKVEITPLSQKPIPKEEDYETYEEFSPALIDWKLDVRDEENAIERQRGIIREERSQSDAVWSDQIEKAAAVHADFDESVKSNLQLNENLEVFIRGSEVGAELAYQLSKDQDRNQDILDMDSRSAARELFNIESTLLNGQKTAQAKTIAPRGKAVSKARAPIAPVGNQSSESTVDLGDPDIPIGEYKARRRAEIAARSGSL